MRKLKPTAPKLYRLRNVIRKPNPTNIITWTSWKPAGQTQKRREMRRVTGTDIINRKRGGKGRDSMVAH